MVSEQSSRKGRKYHIASYLGERLHCEWFVVWEEDIVQCGRVVGWINYIEFFALFAWKSPDLVASHVLESRPHFAGDFFGDCPPRGRPDVWIRCPAESV